MGGLLAVLVDFLPGDGDLLGCVPVVLHGVSVPAVPGLGAGPNLTFLGVLVDCCPLEGFDNEGLLEVLMMEDGVGKDGDDGEDGAADDAGGDWLHGCSALVDFSADTGICTLFCGFLS